MDLGSSADIDASTSTIDIIIMVVNHVARKTKEPEFLRVGHLLTHTKLLATYLGTGF